MTGDSNAPSVKATIMGQLALLIWAMAVCGIVALNDLPAFEILSVFFISGLIASSIMNSINGNWRIITTRPKYLLLAGIVGIIGNDIFYLLAFKYAPAVQVDLIACLWPMIVLILASVFLNENIRFHHIFACIIAFSGIYILLTADPDIGIFNSEYLLGYLFALVSAILWSIYMIVSRKYAQSTPELFAVYCAVGSVFSVSMHVGFETTIIPTSSQWIILIVMGVTTHSLAYYAWDFAIKRGHFKLLNILSYGNPIISIMALVFFGFADLTDELFIATIMVFIAGVIGGYKFKRKKPEAIETVQAP